jgi:hypothetical protein
MHMRLWSCLFLLGATMTACALAEPEPVLLPVPAPPSASSPVPSPPAGATGTRGAPFATVDIPDDLTPASRSHVAELRNAGLFSLGGVGVTGQEPQALITTEALAAERDAVAAFEWLVVNGSAAARVYAYWALRTLDPERASHHAATLASDTDAVETAHGCIISDTTVASLVASFLRPQTSQRPLRLKPSTPP